MRDRKAWRSALAPARAMATISAIPLVLVATPSAAPVAGQPGTTTTTTLPSTTVFGSAQPWVAFEGDQARIWAQYFGTPPASRLAVS